MIDAGLCDKDVVRSSFVAELLLLLEWFVFHRCAASVPTRAQGTWEYRVDVVCGSSLKNLPFWCIHAMAVAEQVEKYAVRCVGVGRWLLHLQVGPPFVYESVIEMVLVNVQHFVTSDSETESDVEGGANFHGWLHGVASGDDVYVPCGNFNGFVQPMTDGPLCGKDAALWFLSEVMPYWEWSDLKRCAPSFPTNLQTDIQYAVYVSPVSPVEDKPLWYMCWWLSSVKLREAAVVERVPDILMLWAYVWPKSSLKEAVVRLGYETRAIYQEVCAIAAWNTHAWDSGVALLPWESCSAAIQSRYILQCNSVFSGLVVEAAWATWSCGRFCVKIPVSEVPRFFSLEAELNIYRVVRHRFSRSLDASGNVRGGSSVATPESEGVQETLPKTGDRVMCLYEHWMQQILTHQKTIELRGQNKKPGCVWIGHKNVIYGRARITRTEALTAERFLELQDQHCLQGHELPYKKTYGLWLEDVRRMKKPIPYLRLFGSQGWARVRYSAQDVVPNAKQQGAVEAQVEDPRPRKLACPQQDANKKQALTAQVETPYPWTLAWPLKQDACLFQSTGVFQPAQNILDWNHAYAQPIPLRPVIGHLFVSANTVGDGACGVHAAFGVTNRQGQLQCHNARDLASASLAKALRSSVGDSAHREAVRLSLWNELAVPGASGEDLVEASIFWEHLRNLYPTEANDVKDTVKQGKQQLKAKDRQKAKLAQVCRYFFCNAPQGVVDAVCAQIGYTAEEGAGDCFEERQGKRFVKGISDTVWQPAWPRSKKEAIQCKDIVFDGLRTSVFLNDLQQGNSCG